MQFIKKQLENDIIQADPLPTESELTQYYENLYYQTSDGAKTSYDTVYTQNEIDHKILESKLALEALNQKKLSPKINALLELGCGEGFFLNEAMNNGYQITGVDFSSFGVNKWNPKTAEFCHFGNVYHYLDKCISEQKVYDVLVLRNVLEHVLSPHQLLCDLKKLLHQDGLALITIPNDYSELQKKALSLNHIQSEYWFAPPDHLHYFNFKNITSFVEKFGFKVIDMYSSFPIDFFLFHPGSNYIKDKLNGKEAHFARVEIDLLMGKEGINKLLDLYRAMAQCGVGRNITVILKNDDI